MSDPNSHHGRAARLGIRIEDGTAKMDRTSLLKSVGGVAGIAESILPSAIFMVAWVVSKNPAIAITGALLPVIGFGIYRLVTKSTGMQVLVGAVIAGFSAWLALRPGGDTRDYFVSGLVINVSYLVPLLISVLVRWPLVGILLGFLIGEGVSWRKNARELRAFSAATLALCAVFVIRLSVELPLYIANQVAALATVKLLLGLPLYALGLWTAWLLVRRVISKPTN